MNQSKKQDTNITVEIVKNFKDINIDSDILKQLAQAVCNSFGLSKATVTIAIVGDSEIAKLNKQFLSHSNPTDVISFDLSDKPACPVKTFDIAVNAEMAIREAHLRGHCAQSELALYITHGLLHNLGFDDSDQDQAKKMHDAEDRLLQQYGFGLIYHQQTSRNKAQDGKCSNNKLKGD